MITSRKTLLALAAVALAQTAVLAWMVFDRIQLLRTGREIVLSIIPIDPRDLFRGEYVRLNYAVASVPLARVQPVTRNETLYVTLEKSGEGEWRPVEVSRTLKQEDGPDRIVLKGRPMGYLRVKYGVESYFVPQGEGAKLEALAREKKLAVLVAVDKAGNAAVKGLIIDGKLQYEEPLL